LTYPPLAAVIRLKACSHHTTDLKLTGLVQPVQFRSVAAIISRRFFNSNSHSLVVVYNSENSYSHSSSRRLVPSRHCCQQRAKITGSYHQSRIESTTDVALPELHQTSIGLHTSRTLKKERKLFSLMTSSFCLRISRLCFCAHLHIFSSCCSFVICHRKTLLFHRVSCLTLQILFVADTVTFRYIMSSRI